MFVEWVRAEGWSGAEGQPPLLHQLQGPGLAAPERRGGPGGGAADGGAHKDRHMHRLWKYLRLGSINSFHAKSTFYALSDHSPMAMKDPTYFWNNQGLLDDQ